MNVRVLVYLLSTDCVVPRSAKSYRSSPGLSGSSQFSAWPGRIDGFTPPQSPIIQSQS